jgi:hypothetical protein
VLSWVLVVVAGLLTAQALGINIKPLLAVGESLQPQQPHQQQQQHEMKE